MNIGLRGKLFAISFVLMAIVGTTSGLYLERQLRDWVVSRTEQAVLTHARSARTLLETAERAADIPEIDEIADRMGRATGARITVVGADGTVLGDSSLSLEGVRKVENHADRPEIRAAFEEGRGTSRRYSDTVEREMLYLAVPFDTERREGVVRASLPLEAVGQNVRRLRLVLLAAGLVGLVVAVVMSGVASHLAARNIRTLVSRAEDRVQGSSSSAEIEVALGDDSPETHAASIEQMARRLERTVDDLARQRNRLEAILESMSDAVLVVDEQRRIELVNSAAADLFRPTDDPTGRPLRELVDQPALDELYDKASEGDRPSVEFEYECEETRHLIAHAAREPTSESVVVVLHDVTELRHLEQVRRDFVANISHELRTPVSIIQANAETLEDGALEDPEHAPQFLDSILRTAERMSNLVDDLLDISRLEAGRYGLEPAPVRLAPVVDQTLVDVRAGLEGDELELTNDVDEELWVTADRQALHQVLLNLVDNAAKYTVDEGRIRVRSRREDGAVVVEVHDTGRGVPEEDRDRVFERFYRVDSGRSREEGGTGLGLSIVKHLVDNMGGEVGYRPAKVRGSIFWFRLPLASNHPDA